MRKYVYLLGVVIAAFLAFATYQAKHGASESAEQIERLEADIAALNVEIDGLQKEFEALSRRDRIAKIATEELGMRPARSHQMVTLEAAERHFGASVINDETLE